MTLQIPPDASSSTPRLRPRWRRTATCLLTACTVAVCSPAAPPVTRGLVLHLESGAGVVTKNGDVVAWQDQSGKGHHVYAKGDPVLKSAATPAGEPAVSLDADDDKFERIHAKDRLALPDGNADRTVLMVARYQEAERWGGLTWGSGDPNRAFGLVIDPKAGTLAVQGWGRGNDHTSDAEALGDGWLLQATVLADGHASLYKDGRAVLQFDHRYNTDLERLVIGEEIAGLGSIGLDVAAVLVYDRALNATERQSVEGYLQQKYLRASHRNAAPSVSILAPKHDSRPSPGEKITFEGKASDPEDGNLAGAIEWRSDRDGWLGRGAAVTHALSTGEHTITALVRDSRDAADQAKITLQVEASKPDRRPPPPKDDDDEGKDDDEDSGRDRGKIVKLFDGKSLDGLYVWSMSEGRNPKEKIFTVKNGMIHVSSDEQYAALISEKEYSNYIMTLEFKWGDRTFGKRRGKARDAGILLHSHGPDGGWKNRLMANLEVQIIEGGMGDLMLLQGPRQMSMKAAYTSGPCENRTWYCRGDHRWDRHGKSLRTIKGNKDRAETIHWYGWDPAFRDEVGFRGRNDLEKPHGQWNQFIVVCDEGRIEVYFNGVKVNEAFDVTPSKGRVQLESEMAEYYVRRWELDLLD